MISDSLYQEAYVWIWLPQTTTPVVAGVLTRVGRQLFFNYGKSYLAREDAIALYAPELPLMPGFLPLVPGLDMPSSIRDAAPDAWGRRVMINRKLGSRSIRSADFELDELTLLLESGSDRVGALDFQGSAKHYLARHSDDVSLEDLMLAAAQVEEGVPLSPGLDEALLHGTSLGGARPKVLVNDSEKKWIAKFSASNDVYNVVKAEFLAMRLAHRVGLNVASVDRCSVLGKDVLLIERFDRVPEENGGWCRRAMVSALTLFELDEMMAAYASYEKLAEIIRHRFSEPKASLRELFSRMVFNVLSGNTDDHARNHAAFWDGHELSLTPAYDICPQSRIGLEASQAMLIRGSRRRSQLVHCIDAAGAFLMGREDAIALVNHQVDVILSAWDSVCDEAGLSQVERGFFWGRQFLNPFAFLEAPEGVRTPLSS